MTPVFKVQRPPMGKGLRIAARPGRQNAIKLVNPAHHRTHKVRWLANPHQVTRLVRGQHIDTEIKRIKHDLLALANRKTTDRMPRKVKFGKLFRTFAPQIFKNTALLNAIKRIAFALDKRILGPLGPAHRHAHGIRGLLFGRRERGAFVKRHGDGRSQQMLDFHRPFRRQGKFAPVDMAFERNTIFGNLAQLGQRHHLIPAAIGQDRLVPIHEFVQTAKACNAFRTGAQHQVICIAQKNLRTRIGDIFRQHALDRGSRSNRHEGRGIDHAVGGMNAAETGLAVGRQKFITEFSHQLFSILLAHSSRLQSP